MLGLPQLFVFIIKVFFLFEVGDPTSIKLTQHQLRYYLGLPIGLFSNSGGERGIFQRFAIDPNICHFTFKYTPNQNQNCGHATENRIFLKVSVQDLWRFYNSY